MAGRPLTRSRKEAGMQWCYVCQRWFAGQSCDVCEERAARLRNVPVPVFVPEFATPPIAPDTVRAGTHARTLLDLHAEALANAESALAAVRRGLETGMDARDVKDLALTASTLMRATKLVESKVDADDPMTPEQLDRELAYQRALDAESKRRGDG